MTARRLGLLALAIGLSAQPVGAFHRTTPQVVPISTGGDDFLPRVPALGDRLALALGAGQQIFRYDRHTGTLEALTTAGTSANPTISSGGSVVAWDTDCDLLGCEVPGRQIIMRKGPIEVQVTFDPTGTSANPVLSGRGNRVVFESEGDLAGTGNPGARQIFQQVGVGPIEQVSRGVGTSANATLSKSGRIMAFDSTSHPATGEDTGVSQIWLSSRGGELSVLTAGAGPSRRPGLAANGNFLAFESRAALAGDGSDTGVWQLFGYDLTTGAYYQLTADPAGCTGASVDDIRGDFRVGYTCGGVGYVHQVRANLRARVPVEGGDTAQAVVELGVHFVVVSTTADPVNGGTTPGHHVYLLNLFKLPPVPVSSDALQF